MQILKVNGADYAIKPTGIVPDVEVIQTAQRSICGTMHVDRIAEKTNLKIIWGLATQAELKQIQQDFAHNDDGIEIAYFGAEDGENTGRYYFTGISYAPAVMGDCVRWKDVTVSLAQQ